MGNLIIGAILIVIVALGISSSVKHFKGEGGCCGGSSTIKVKKRKIKNVVCKKTVGIEGMHCDNCKNRVEEALNDLPGVRADVKLKKKTALITAEREVPENEIKSAVEKLGYKVINIQ